MKKKSGIILLLLVVVLTLVACGGANNAENNAVDNGASGTNVEESGNEEAVENETDAADETDLAESEDVQKIKESGKLVLATCADYPPFEWHMMIDGKDTVVGFDIAIAQSVADSLGVELEIKDLDFEGVIPSLGSGQADIAIAGLVPTPEREEVVSFTEPYYQNGQVIIVHKDNVDEFTSVEDFSGKKIGAQLSTTQEAYVKENFPEDIELLSLSKVNNLVMEVKNKTIDGLFLIDNAAEPYVAQNDDLVILDIEFPPEPGNAIAVAKDMTDLADYIDAHLKTLKEDGTLDEYIEKYTQMAEDQEG